MYPWTTAIMVTRGVASSHQSSISLLLPHGNSSTINNILNPSYETMEKQNSKHYAAAAPWWFSAIVVCCFWEIFPPGYHRLVFLNSGKTLVHFQSSDLPMQYVFLVSSSERQLNDFTFSLHIWRENIGFSQSQLLKLAFTRGKIYCPSYSVK